MVEFVLVLPVLFFVLGAAVDLGRLFYAYIAVDSAAKEGALAGARQPLCDNTGLAICANPNNVVWHVTHEAPNLVDGSGNSLLSTTVACRQPDGTLVQSITDCLDGYTYQVTVSMPFQLVTPLLSSVMPRNFTLSKEAQSTVVTDAFDPSGLEVLLWASTTNSLNPSEITTNCTLADATNSPGFYYQPCQDSLNQDHYLQFNEGQTVTYKVRVRNTGNITLTNISYAFSENSTSFAMPGACSTLPTTLAASSGSTYCTFTRTASILGAGGAAQDDIVSVQTSALAAGLPAGTNTTSTDIKVVPAPRLAVNLGASPWRLGGSTGNGTNGAPSFNPGAALTLNRDTASSAAEIVNPTGWLYLTVQNQGGPASNLTVSLTRAGTSVAIPASCNVPTSLGAAGQPTDTFTCAIPQPFTATGAVAFTATAGATNALTVTGTQPSVSVTTNTCSSGKKVVPNLVDTLSPTADGSVKTVSQAQSVWAAAGFTGALSTNPAGAAGTTTISQQDQTAYTCQNATSAVTVTAP